MSDFLPDIKDSSEFCPGNTKNCVDMWRRISTDTEVIRLIQGLTIDGPRVQEFRPSQYKFNENQKIAITEEVKKLVEAKIVSEIYQGWSYIGNIFVVPKPNNKFRLIIDLSFLNDSIKKVHFKMDNLETAVNMMFKGAFMASIDLKDAYHTIPIADRFKPFVRFQWEDHVYMFHVMPFG